MFIARWVQKLTKLQHKASTIQTVAEN